MYDITRTVAERIPITGDNKHWTCPGYGAYNCDVCDNTESDIANEKLDPPNLLWSAVSWSWGRKSEKEPLKQKGSE